MQYPLSPDEHAAIIRHVADIRRQLKHVSELFASRYGNESRIADLAGKTLLSSTLLERETMLLQPAGETPIQQIARAV